MIIKNIVERNTVNTDFVFFNFAMFVCARLATTSDKAYQLLAHGRWFSPGTPASSTTKNGLHDIAEILLKVALSTIKQSINQSTNVLFYFCLLIITYYWYL